MIVAFSYVRAFKRNCPGVRMTADEETELARLVRVAQDKARQQGVNEAFEEINRKATGGK